MLSALLSALRYLDECSQMMWHAMRDAIEDTIEISGQITAGIIVLALLLTMPALAVAAIIWAVRS